MNTSQVRLAFEKFNLGNYSAALEIYENISKVLGEEFFAANILLCKKKIRSIRDASKHENIKIEEELVFLHNSEPVELINEKPFWYSISVTPGQELILSAAVNYENIISETDKKAVLLLNAYDSNGSIVSKSCGKLSKSAKFKSYFKYLPSTKNQQEIIHTFTVSQHVNEIRIGLCSFNAKLSEKVFVSNFCIKSAPIKPLSTEFVPPSTLSAEISISGWPEYPPNGKPYVIGVMDEFTTGCFEQDVNLIQPRPDNWYALAEKYPPALFFIESAWKGNFGSWQYRIAHYANKPGHEVADICEYARKKNIPTLFWNKEDPVHHEKFMCSANLVDHIFTTDSNMRESYCEKTGNLNVHALPFAAQPVLHKPSPLLGRKRRACFAGSWYGDRHAERGEAINWLLNSANRHGLDIYDRNFGTDIFPFPKEYQACIKGSLPYKELCNEYARYRVFLNVNSVTDSPTMFSRRVFELMACGTPIVSTYAKGIENLFESDAVWMVQSQEEAEEAIFTLMSDDVEWRRRSLAGIREIFSKHTYAHRLNYIFEKLSISTRIKNDPLVLLIAKINDINDINVLNKFATNQVYLNFRMGIECPQNLKVNNAELCDRIELLAKGEARSWLELNQSQHSIAGCVSSNNQYGQYYIRDLVNATIYEPEACGWAKSVNHDYYAYGKSTVLDGAVWKTSEFIKEYFGKFISNQLAESVNPTNLFVTDSDQFISRSNILIRS